ncbi:MAG TPA: hypothetical protein VGO93_30830 [Candidatus Xenobia bacterium]|jgi:hypothetical protein
MIESTFKRYPVGTSAVHAIATPLYPQDTRGEDTSVVRSMAGSIGAVVCAVFKTVPGAIQGLVTGARFNPAEEAPSHRADTGVYTLTTIAETMAAGAGFGAMAGPLGMLVGTGTGFVVGVLNRVGESKSKSAQGFVQKVDDRVDAYLTFNGDENGGRVHNLMEGTKIGAQAGWRQGLNQGRAAGVGLLDTAQDHLANLREAIFGR